MKTRSACLVILCGALTWLASAQNAKRAESATFIANVEPFLKKNCISCHNEKLKSSGLSLENARENSPFWDGVMERIATGKMPPAGQPAPDKTELAAAMRWL